jgi:hypothetical protein
MAAERPFQHAVLIVRRSRLQSELCSWLRPCPNVERGRDTALFQLGESAIVRFGRLQTLVTFGIAVLALGIVAVPEAAAQPTGSVSLQWADWNADVVVDLDQNLPFSQLVDAGCCSCPKSGGADDSGREYGAGLSAGSTLASITGSSGNYFSGNVP